MSVGAVVFDVSGTVIDFGSRGPVAAFVELFRRHGFSITEEQARRPMGVHKKDHIRAVLEDARIPWSGALLESMYQEFIPLQTEVLRSHCDLIPGVLATVEALRTRGIPFACTTGFVSPMMRELIPAVTEAGFRPQIFVTPDQVGSEGRPSPRMLQLAARKMNIEPMSRIVKVGDTPVDVAEGRNAGTWTVSVIDSGNEVGLSRDQLAAFAPAERDARIAAARARLAAMNPHYLIASVADLLPVLDEIGRRIDKGEQP